MRNNSCPEHEPRPTPQKEQKRKEQERDVESYALRKSMGSNFWWGVDVVESVVVPPAAPPLY